MKYKKAEQMTNEEFMKDFADFQDNWEQENEEWFAEASTMISASPSMSAKKTTPKKKANVQTTEVSVAKQKKKDEPSL